jgi:DNA-binding CsgD family transcriptional regulator
MNLGIAFAALRFVLEGGTYVPPSILSICREVIGPSSTSRLIGRADEEDEAETADDRIGNGPDLAVPASPFGDAAEREAVGSLTSRQRAVLDDLGRGRINTQIARDLDLSEATVKVHVREVLRRLGVANRTQAAVIASNTLSHTEPSPPGDSKTSVGGRLALDIVDPGYRDTMKRPPGGPRFIVPRAAEPIRTVASGAFDRITGDPRQTIGSVNQGSGPNGVRPGTHEDHSC